MGRQEPGSDWPGKGWPGQEEPGRSGTGRDRIPWAKSPWPVQMAASALAPIVVAPAALLVVWAEGGLDGIGRGGLPVLAALSLAAAAGTGVLLAGLVRGRPWAWLGVIVMLAVGAGAVGAVAVTWLLQHGPGAAAMLLLPVLLLAVALRLGGADLRAHVGLAGPSVPRPQGRTLRIVKGDATGDRAA